MNYTIDHKSNEQKDRRKSAVITAVVAILAFLIIFFYKFTRLIPQKEVVTTMLINFGDNQNGDGAEEPDRRQRRHAPAADQRRHPFHDTPRGQSGRAERQSLLDALFHASGLGCLGGVPAVLPG